ncbi:MAG: acetyltransferase, partial [Bacteroidales bacterium]
MQSFLFNILKYSLYLWALLPLRVLYVLSDLLYFPLYYVMGY